jgi:hypothetical protein
LSSSIGDQSVSFTVLISWRPIDSLTSKVSTAPYSVADMQTMCDIINKIKGAPIFAVLRNVTLIQCRPWSGKSSRNILRR